MKQRSGGYQRTLLAWVEMMRARETKSQAMATFWRRRLLEVRRPLLAANAKKGQGAFSFSMGWKEPSRVIDCGQGHDRGSRGTECPHPFRLGGGGGVVDLLSRRRAFFEPSDFAISRLFPTVWSENEPFQVPKMQKVDKCLQKVHTRTEESELGFSGNGIYPLSFDDLLSGLDDMAAKNIFTNSRKSD